MTDNTARIAALEARLTLIDDALTQLALGQRVVKLNHDGQSVEYQQSDEAALLRLQLRTKSELATLQGTAQPWGRMRKSY